MPTHKKGHDKDKYYYLAKDQGFRSRASYKLIQINKRYDFLSKAKVCIDLCAAPGGWCQVAEKTMAQGSIILGVDLLPIRALRNVKTIVNDITTSECRKLIQQELQGWKADVVLCDGAPNIGSAYSKDAYVQNELVIAALKTATEHLTEGGTFCTKVYRSVDYNAIVWVLQQLFEDVQTMKPNSSRSQSSEIFLVCLKYMAPKSIDPRLLDPNYVFKEVKDPGLKKVDVLHKKYEKSNKRQRSGYDDSLGITLSSKVSISDFLSSSDPVQILTDASELIFTDSCQVYKDNEAMTPELLFCFQDLRVLGKIDFKKILKWRQQMRAEYNIKTGKGPMAKSTTDGNDDDDDNDDNKESVKIHRPILTEEEIMEEELTQLKQKTLHKDRKEKKKARELMSKTRKRLEAGMLNNAFQEAADMELFSWSNIHSNKPDAANEDEHGERTVEEEEEDELLNYTTVDNDEYNAYNLSSKKKHNIKGYDDDKEDDDEGSYDEEKELAALEEELEYDYKRYVSKKKLKHMQEDAKLKASKKYKRQHKDNNSDDDDNDEYKDLEFDPETTTGLRHSSESNDNDEDNEFIDQNQDKKKNKKIKKGRIDSSAVAENKAQSHDLKNKKNNSATLSTAVLKHTTEWFSQPLFQDVLNTKSKLSQNIDDNDDDDDYNNDTEEFDNIFDATDDDNNADNNEVEVENDNKKKLLNTKNKKDSRSIPVTNKFEMPDMPKTDKQIRKEKRKKQAERNERKQMKRATRDAPDQDDDDDNVLHNNPYVRDNTNSSSNDSKGSITNAEDRVYTEKDLQKMRLIEQGMGKSLTKDKAGRLMYDSNAGFEIVPRIECDDDNSKHNNSYHNEDEHDWTDRDEDDNEDDEEDSLETEYKKNALKNKLRQSDDKPSAESRVMTLALGTLMLNKSRKKAMIDASYNRYSWNENSDELPAWFIEDEMRHNKPQVPIPSALIDQIKGRFKITGTKEIKKVAEARMRKRKRALNKLNAAKKKANAMAESTDMSQREKMKAINRAMRESKITKPGKTYVITKKTGGASTGTKSGDGKGKLKFVDKRLKKDKRATRVNKKRSKK